MRQIFLVAAGLALLFGFGVVVFLKTSAGGFSARATYSTDLTDKDLAAAGTQMTRYLAEQSTSK